MPGLAGVTIDRLRPDELREAAALTALCFADEPFQAYLLDDVPPERRVPLMTPFFLTSLRAVKPPGIIHAARLDGALVGVRVMTRHEGRASRGLGELAARLRLRLALGRVVRRAPRYREARKVGRAIDALRPAGPYWYLEWLAVDPAAAGRGAAHSLTEAAIVLCDEEGIGCFFGTFTDVVKSYCERLGFVVTHELPLLPGGPPYWVMWREPRAAASASASRR